MYFSVEIKSNIVVSAFISDNYFGKQTFVDNCNSLQGNVLFPFWLFQHSVPNKYNFFNVKHDLLLCNCTFDESQAGFKWDCSNK